MTDREPSKGALHVAQTIHNCARSGCGPCEKIALALDAFAQQERSAADAQMLLVKACEHIAEGDEGWEVLRNECPSTAAVATLRDAYDGVRTAVSKYKEIAQQARDAALEEAAAIADEDQKLGRLDLDDPALNGLAGARILAGERIAYAIRVLKSKPTAGDRG